jgi:hypothetical protein
MNLAVLRARVAHSRDLNAEEREFLLYLIHLSAATVLCRAYEKEALTLTGQGLKGAHGRRA